VTCSLKICFKKLRKKSEFCSKNRNFVQKIEILFKKSKLCLKTRNFVQISKFCSRNRNFIQISQFCSKIEIVFKKSKFCELKNGQKYDDKLWKSSNFWPFSTQKHFDFLNNISIFAQNFDLWTKIRFSHFFFHFN